MNQSQLTKLTLEVSIENATPDEVGRMTRQWLVERKSSDAKSAQLTRAITAPKGTRPPFEGSAEQLRNVLENLDKGKARK